MIKEVENVNMGGRRVNKHAKLWATSGGNFIVSTQQINYQPFLKMKVLLKI
jgi:hypothetical protein